MRAGPQSLAPQRRLTEETLRSHLRKPLLITFFKQVRECVMSSSRRRQGLLIQDMASPDPTTTFYQTFITGHGLSFDPWGNPAKFVYPVKRQTRK